MILILSQTAMEPTTEEVMDWLEALGAPCLRLNGEDLDGGAELRLTLDGDPGPGGARAALGIEVDGAELPLGAVSAVWFRRWMSERRHESVRLLDELTPEGERLHFEIRRHLNLESRKLSDFVFASLDGRPWLSRPRATGAVKLDVLARAAHRGLDIPPTLVTTRKDALAAFCARHGTLITKPIGEVELFVAGERRYLMFTTPVDAAAIAELPARFPPSLFQQRLEKELEVRVFYLDGECHAMAIFSQTDPQTRDDFRRYNRARPNRMVPYRLPLAVEERLGALMRDLDLETGSLDLIRLHDGRLVFLEVNPVGQFGMVSRPCNYQLEKKVAELLIRKSKMTRLPGGI